MLSTPDPDPQVEFLAEQLKRVRWISGYKFIPVSGYLLEWLPEGIHRMMRFRTFGTPASGSSELQTMASPATLVRIIESWTRQPSSP